MTGQTVQILAIVPKSQANAWLREYGESDEKVALSQIKDDLSKYIRLAEHEEIIITRHGKPAGILVGFASQDDWFDYKLEHDPRFVARIARARESMQAGKGIKLEDVPREPKATSRRRR